MIPVATTPHGIDKGAEAFGECRLRGSKPGVQFLPPLIVCANPACRKLDEMLSNCLQPILILFPLVGSTQMEGSFAASPTMLLPLALTLTW